MAFVTADRILETTSTSGTGTLTLSGAKPGYRTFASVMSTSDTCYYAIVDYAGSTWEIGYGTLVTSTTLSRGVIIASSNAGSAVNFANNVKDVFIDVPASQLVQVATTGVTYNPISLTNPLILPADPSQPLHASTKGYVDTQIATVLPKAGGTMTGPLVLPADPNAPYQASTKQYVDTMLPLAGGTMTGPLLGSQVLTSGNASFDTRGATVVAGSNAFWLADGQTIAFDTAGSNTLFWDSSDVSIRTPATFSSPTIYGGRGRTVTWSGSTVPNANFGFIGSVALAGTTTNSLASAYSFSVSADTLDAGSASPATISQFLVNTNLSGGLKGGRNAFQVVTNFLAASGNPVYTYKIYTAGGFDMNVKSSDGGNNMFTGTAGTFSAINPQIIVSTGVTYLTSATGAEFDIALQGTSTTAVKSGISIVQLSSDSSRGAVDDAAILLANQVDGTAPGWNNGLQFGSAATGFPMYALGTLISIVAQQRNPNRTRTGLFKSPALNRGIDIRYASYASDAIASPNFAVSNIGDIRFSNASLTAKSDGINLDIPSQKVSAVTIVNAGAATTSGANNYYPQDRLVGPSGASIYRVTTTKVIVAAISNGGTGGTNGTQTVTGTTGGGTRFQASVTVSGGAITAILSITVPGAYTFNPTIPWTEPVTGAGLTGAVLSVGMGINTITIEVPDVSPAGITGAVAYPNPVSFTNGSGFGATFNLTWVPANTLRLNSSGGTTIIDGSSLQVTNNATVNGTLTLASDPSSPYQAATRNYVDTNTVTKTYVDSTSSPNAGRNKIHNSKFSVSQRGFGPWTVSSAYTADRWQLSLIHSTGSMSASLVSQTDTGRGQIGDEESGWVLQYVFTGGTGATDYDNINQRIETVRRLSGKSVVVSFYAASSTGTPKIGVSIDQLFGTGGSPSSTVNGAGQSVTITSTWARYTLNFSVPSAIGKTFGTNNDNSTQLNFWFSSGTTQATRAGLIGVQSNTIFLWGVQLEIGTMVTPLEKLEYANDLAICQRFYQTGIVQEAGYGIAGGFVGVVYPFPTIMRNTPNILSSFSTNVNVTSPNVNAQSLFGYQVAGNISTTAQYNLFGSFTASADF